MSTDDLLALYQATEQDLRHALGTLLLPEGPVPVVQICQPGWNRELLTAVRAALADGVELASQMASDDTVQLHLSARQQVSLRVERDGQTFVLPGPAWDAQLSGIAPAIAAHFLAMCQRTGQFWLVLATPAWLCRIHVQFPSGSTRVGEIQPCP